MWKKFVALGVLVLVVKIRCDCEQDQCYKKLKNETNNVEEKFRDGFDDILQLYNVTENRLKNVINYLNKNVTEAENKLKDANNKNKIIKERNKKFYEAIERLKNELKKIDEDLDKLDFGNVRDLLKELNATLPVDISPDILNNIEKMNRMLSDFEEVLKNYDSKRKSLTNLPHSTADEIDLIDSLLNERRNDSCLDDYHKQLKDLFQELAKLINLENALKRLNEYQKDASNNEEKARDILKLAETIRKDNEDFDKTKRLAQKILDLAERVEKFKKDVDKKENDIKNIADQNQKNFENKLQKLFEKYKTSDYVSLLEKLENTINDMDELAKENGKTAQELKEDIDEYVKRIDKAIEFIENCQK